MNPNAGLIIEKIALWKVRITALPEAKTTALA